MRVRPDVDLDGREAQASGQRAAQAQPAGPGGASLLSGLQGDPDDRESPGAGQQLDALVDLILLAPVVPPGEEDRLEELAVQLVV